MPWGPTPLLRILAAVTAVAALILSACSTYRAGPPGAVPFRSVFVEIIENETALPQATALLTRQIRENLTARGDTTLAASPRRADHILRVTLTDLDQSPRADLPADTTRAASYDLRVSAAITLLDSSGAIARESTVAASTVVYLNPSLPDARHQAVPRLTADLAQRIADVVLHPWSD